MGWEDMPKLTSMYFNSKWNKGVSTSLIWSCKIEWPLQDGCIWLYSWHKNLCRFWVIQHHICTFYIYPTCTKNFYPRRLCPVLFYCIFILSCLAQTSYISLHSHCFLYLLFWGTLAAFLAQATVSLRISLLNNFFYTAISCVTNY